MKKALLILTLLLSVRNAHALIADQFSCEIQISEIGTTQTTKQSMEFSIARVPQVNSPIEVNLTKARFDGSLQTSTKERSIHTSISLYYHHAAQTDQIGQTIDARQTSCIVVTADYCDHRAQKPGDMQICSTSKGACALPTKPFDPVHGWPSVSIAPDGTPMFDEKSLPVIDTKFYDEQKRERGTVRFTCQYKGTYT